MSDEVEEGAYRELCDSSRIAINTAMKLIITGDLKRICADIEKKVPSAVYCILLVV